MTKRRAENNDIIETIAAMIGNVECGTTFLRKSRINDKEAFNRIFDANIQRTLNRLICRLIADLGYLEFMRRKKGEEVAKQYRDMPAETAVKLVRHLMYMNRIAKQSTDRSLLTKGLFNGFVDLEDPIHVFGLAKEVVDWYQKGGSQIIGNTTA